MSTVSNPSVSRLTFKCSADIKVRREAEASTDTMPYVISAMGLNRQALGSRRLLRYQPLAAERALAAP